MNRELPSFFHTWQTAKERKPLILKGVRQVGKTTSLKKFGSVAFDTVHYFNFERQKNIHSVFTKETSPDAIIDALTLLSERKIDLTRDLIILDEIQQCPAALTSLKYFSEEKPWAYVMAAGSLLGIKLGEDSFPVGKIEIHELFPLSFTEFLAAIEKEPLAKAVLQSPSQTTVLAIEEKIFELFTHYCVTGGLPESVQTYIDGTKTKATLLERLFAVREKQKDLIETYENDMAKHSGKLHSMHIRRVWEDVPRQLSRMNQKFQFKDVIPGKRSFADLVGPLDWLLSAGLLIQSPIINEAQVPLKNYIQPNQFRLFCFDIGILSALADFPIPAILNLTNENLLFKGPFLENFVAQTLHRFEIPIFTWMRNTSEIEFLIQTKYGQIIPIEVKSRINSKAKSLRLFLEKYPFVQDFAILSLDFEQKGKHFPVTRIDQLISIWNQTVPQTELNQT